MYLLHIGSHWPQGRGVDIFGCHRTCLAHACRVIELQWDHMPFNHSLERLQDWLSHLPLSIDRHLAVARTEANVVQD